MTSRFCQERQEHSRVQASLAHEPPRRRDPSKSRGLGAENHRLVAPDLRADGGPLEAKA